MLTVTAIAADHFSSTFTNYIRAMANYRDCPQTTHKSHSPNIFEWQHTLGKLTFDINKTTSYFGVCTTLVIHAYFPTNLCA
jgi:hypothetical protein